MPSVETLGRRGAFFRTGRKQGGTAAVPLLSEMRAETTKVTKDREGSRAALRSCAGGLGKHLNCALAPLVSAELKILRKDLEGCQDNSV